MLAHTCVWAPAAWSKVRFQTRVHVCRGVVNRSPPTVCWQTSLTVHTPPGSNWKYSADTNVFIVSDIPSVIQLNRWHQRPHQEGGLTVCRSPQHHLSPSHHQRLFPRSHADRVRVFQSTESTQLVWTEDDWPAAENVGLCIKCLNSWCYNLIKCVELKLKVLSRAVKPPNSQQKSQRQRYHRQTVYSTKLIWDLLTVIFDSELVTMNHWGHKVIPSPA